MLLSQLWAQQDIVSTTLPQYGALGVIAAVCIFGIAKMFNNQIASHKAEIERNETAHREAIARADAAYDREVNRGDRLESELRELNKLVNDKLAGELVRATDAIREAFDTMHEQRRSGR